MTFQKKIVYWLSVFTFRDNDSCRFVNSTPTLFPMAVYPVEKMFRLPIILLFH